MVSASILGDMFCTSSMKGSDKRSEWLVFRWAYRDTRRCRVMRRLRLVWGERGEGT